MFAVSDSVQASFHPPKRSMINNFLQYSGKKALSHTPVFPSLVTHAWHDIQGEFYCIIVFSFFLKDFLLLFCPKVPMGKQKYRRRLKSIKSLTKTKDT